MKGTKMGETNPADAADTPEADAGIPTSVAPPARDRTLSPAEIAVESARLVIGLAALVGSGFVALLERYGIPEAELHPDGGPPPPALADGDPTATDAVRLAVHGLLGLVRSPADSSAPRRNVLAGFALDLPGMASRLRTGTRRRAAPVFGLAARAAAFGPVAARVERTQAVLDRWHTVGSREMEANRQYAAAVLDAGARLGMDWIVDNLNLDLIIKNLDLNRILADLELTDIIVESTGGVTERTLESVRSQAVGADGLVDRLVGRTLRRRTRDAPKGPALLVGDPGATGTAGDNGSVVQP
ncbi:MAG: hypothetical protein IT198_15600 [Acidimicrobiia bacterium]|nr:hypothetical protein [Acidimicrobiia bacterium]